MIPPQNRQSAIPGLHHGMKIEHLPMHKEKMTYALLWADVLLFLIVAA